MNFAEYRPLALRTAKMFPTQRENLRHAVLGLITEVGELTTDVKRHVVYGKPLALEMMAHMREEGGDAQWYVPLLMFALGVDELPAPPEGLLETTPMDLADACAYLAVMVGGLSVWYLNADAFHGATDAMDMAAGLVYVLDNVIAPAIGTTGDVMRAENIAKLRLRYPDKYSDEAAEARADKGGLPATVS